MGENKREKLQKAYSKNKLYATTEEGEANASNHTSVGIQEMKRNNGGMHL